MRAKSYRCLLTSDDCVTVFLFVNFCSTKTSSVLEEPTWTLGSLLKSKSESRCMNLDDLDASNHTGQSSIMSKVCLNLVSESKFPGWIWFSGSAGSGVGPQTLVTNIRWHCGNSSRRHTSDFCKPELEKAVSEPKSMEAWQLAGYEAAAQHRKWQLSRAVMPRRSRRSPPTDGSDCLRTLSHALDPPGHQNKCRQASLSSWVRRLVCVWTQVWLLR